jgi:hypothetical protein
MIQEIAITSIFLRWWENTVHLRQMVNLCMLPEKMLADTLILKSEINSGSIFDASKLTGFL